jgi:ABC-2 type transport system ATP-binding protein
VTDPAQAAPAVTRALVAADADVLSLTGEQATLEDVYLKLIEKPGTVKPGKEASAR